MFQAWLVPRLNKHIQLAIWLLSSRPSTIDAFEQKPKTHGTGLIRHSPTYYHSSSSSQPSHGALLIRRALAQLYASLCSSCSCISSAPHCSSQQLDTLSLAVYSVRTELPPLWLACGVPVAEDEVPLRACLRSQGRRSNWSLGIVLM